ncbi:MAG: thiamine pyrophosphate-dependent enzyme [Nostocoides sp.]
MGTLRLTDAVGDGGGRMGEVMESVDDHFGRRVREWQAGEPVCRAPGSASDRSVSDGDLLALFAAQLTSRHLDFAARILQAAGEGFYTIGSAGHESNAAVALALRPTDPALLHYRSGGFYCARAGQVEGHDPARDTLLSVLASADDPISGGRHKVFGHHDLAIIPQTSTIASHLPRALGLAFAHERAHGWGRPDEWPADAVVVASLGDASLNHSTAVGALNAAGHAIHQGVPIPLLVLVEDNGIGISVKSPAGWTDSAVARLDRFALFSADGANPVGSLAGARAAVARVRTTRRPAVLHLRTVRFMGHAGSDAEVAYRSGREIAADHNRDPLLATAAELVTRGVLTPTEVVERYEIERSRITDLAAELVPTRRLGTAAEVAAPLTARRDEEARRLALVAAADRAARFGGKLPESSGPLTLAQSLNAALTDLLAAHPQAMAFGEDVAVKGGVYGVTRGLRRTFGAARVFDTLLDEQTILGTALGSALAGLLPIPEIQYLAYLHNAEDQLRGEAATLAFFSNGQYTNGMLVRIPGLAYQRGFGGHFHNDNSLAVLRDIPGIVVGIPSSPAEAPGMVRAMAGLALAEGRVCVLVEPIAIYHARDILPGDGAATAPYAAPSTWAQDLPMRDEGVLLADGSAGEEPADVLVITFGNGVGMTRRALAAFTTAQLLPSTPQQLGRCERGRAPRVDVYDLRWIAPLPADHLARIADAYAAVLVVDETRRSGGVSEGVVTALVDRGYRGIIRRVTSEDSVIALGPAAAAVLLGEADIVRALVDMRAIPDLRADWTCTDPPLENR